MSAAHSPSPSIDDDSAERGGLAPPTASGGLPFLGHLLELRRQPITLMQLSLIHISEPTRPY